LELNVPVLIEAMSYRVGHHSTSDDSTVYRSQSEVELHRRHDNPSDRFGKYMVRSLIGGAVAVASGAWSKDEFAVALARGSTSDPEGPEQTRRRLGHGDRAPAAGLVLWSVEYPPADDPFTAQERREASEVPRGPPFSTD
jgi:tRNA U38,U39,U40 pseudouridine synthase TruA